MKKKDYKKKSNVQIIRWSTKSGDFHRRAAMKGSLTKVVNVLKINARKRLERLIIAVVIGLLYVLR